MNVHGAGEVGGFFVVEPIVVGEPGVGFGDGDEVAGAFVVDSVFHFALGVEDAFDAGNVV